MPENHRPKAHGQASGIKSKGWKDDEMWIAFTLTTFMTSVVSFWLFEQLSCFVCSGKPEFPFVIIRIISLSPAIHVAAQGRCRL